MAEGVFDRREIGAMLTYDEEKRCAPRRRRLGEASVLYEMRVSGAWLTRSNHPVVQETGLKSPTGIIVMIATNKSSSDLICITLTWSLRWTSVLLPDETVRNSQ